MKANLIENHPTIESVKSRLVELSNTLGGAWSFSACFGKVWFYQAASPSRLPDHLHADTTLHGGDAGIVAYRGRLQGFTRGQIIREQNRAISCE